PDARGTNCSNNPTKNPAGVGTNAYLPNYKVPACVGPKMNQNDLYVPSSSDLTLCAKDENVDEWLQFGDDFQALSNFDKLKDWEQEFNDRGCYVDSSACSNMWKPLDNLLTKWDAFLQEPSLDIPPELVNLLDATQMAVEGLDDSFDAGYGLDSTANFRGWLQECFGAGEWWSFYAP